MVCLYPFNLANVYMKAEKASIITVLVLKGKNQDTEKEFPHFPSLVMTVAFLGNSTLNGYQPFFISLLTCTSSFLFRF